MEIHFGAKNFTLVLFWVIIIFWIWDKARLKKIDYDLGHLCYISLVFGLFFFISFILFLLNT